MAETYLDLSGFKTRAGISHTNDDAVLGTIIAPANDFLEQVVGRALTKTFETQYLSGNGSPYLNLRFGPLHTTASVWYVSYASDGTESLSAVDAGSYRLEGVESEKWKLPSALVLDGSTWTPGRRNIKVSAWQGFAPAPDMVVQTVRDIIQWMFQRRKDIATESRDIGSGVETFSSHRALRQMVESRLEEYIPDALLSD